MANLLSSLNIEVMADLCDCQYTSSGRLCSALEPVKKTGKHLQRLKSEDAYVGAAICDLKMQKHE